MYIYQLLDYKFNVGYYSDLDKLQTAAKAYIKSDSKVVIGQFTRGLVDNDDKCQLTIDDHIFTVIKIPLDNYYNTFYSRKQI